MSGMSSSESGTTTTIELMSDSPSPPRLPLKSDNQRGEHRTDAEIIEQQAQDMQRHEAWHWCRLTVESAHDTWREATQIVELQAQELQALNAAASEARRMEAAQIVELQAQAVASETTRIEHATIPMTTENQQQADQRWRESNEGQAQIGELDDLIRELSADNDMSDMLTSMTLKPVAPLGPLEPTRARNAQESNLQIVQPHHSDPAMPSTR
jgi:hypothetical protein